MKNSTFTGVVGAVFGTLGGMILTAILLNTTFVTHCSKNPWDPTLTYGTEVKIHSGFFAGSKGVIEAQTWQYQSDACNTAAFKVSVYNGNVGTWEEVQIAQANLEKQ